MSAEKRTGVGRRRNGEKEKKMSKRNLDPRGGARTERGSLSKTTKQKIREGQKRKRHVRR